MPLSSPQKRWRRNNVVKPSPPLLEALTTQLRTMDGAIQDYLEWLQARFESCELEVLAFLPEAERFDRLRQEAEELLHQYPEPEGRPLVFGLPLGVKDIFHVNGFKTHAGSNLPPKVIDGDQASCVSALRAAGALVLGKTVTTEFAYFAPGPTRNPHHPMHTPGGSSSGSAAAVAAGLAPLALGTQTIGSINRPAAFCGTVGYKPTYARISTQGVIPLSPSLDHIGYFTPDAASAAWIAPLLVDDWSQADLEEKTLRLVIPTGPYMDNAEPAALEQFESDCKLLQAAGHTVLELTVMDDFESIVECHNLILAADAAKVHESWFGSYAEQYHPKTSDLIRRGRTISADDYKKALRGREETRFTLTQLMDENDIDLWITPSAPGPAPEGLESTGDPVMNLPWTQSGMPTLTLPSGKTSEGLPLGLQLIGRSGDDEQLLSWANNLEGHLQYESIHGLQEFLDTRQ
jgi:Asp-tRNA(Asn)/Glu-tRNA(Gln) amidotransferase A subunit family amidase